MSKRKKRRLAPPPGALCSMKRLKLLMKRGHKHKDIKIHAVSTYTHALYNIDLDNTAVIKGSLGLERQFLCAGRESQVDLHIYNVTHYHKGHCYLFENYWLAYGYLLRVMKGEIPIDREETDNG